MMDRIWVFSHKIQCGHATLRSVKPIRMPGIGHTPHHRQDIGSAVCNRCLPRPVLSFKAQAQREGGFLACNVVRVLLVEDEGLIRELVEPALEDGGFSVVTASSGEGAMALLGTGDSKWQALITDVNLGAGPTGWAVATRARELESGLPVIYMTGGNAHEWTSKGVPNSILIEKPFAPVQIVTAVAQLLNSGER
jgi:CheY-like chemotaxis protein